MIKLMDRRYQVFVSSTYKDLHEERAEVMQALLELDCMPAGMELFPAANEEQWKWITRVIDESDYYVVVIGGKYGTIHEESGTSYTEREYRYAVELAKPVIAFIHEDPSRLEVWRSDTTEEARDKLSDFRDLVQKRLCKHWSTPHDLGAKVSRSMTQLIRHHPAEGWVRAHFVDQHRAEEVLKMKKRIEELEEQIGELSNQPPEGIQELSKEDDKISIAFVYETRMPKVNKVGSTYWVRRDEYASEIITTWNEIFAAIAPKMLAPQDRGVIIRSINSFLWPSAKHDIVNRKTDERLEDVKLYVEAIEN